MRTFKPFIISGSYSGYRTAVILCIKGHRGVESGCIYQRCSQKWANSSVTLLFRLVSV